MQQHFQVTRLVHHLRGQEDLGLAVRREADQTARALERGGLADAVVAQRGDQALASVRGELRLGRGGPMTEFGVGQVTLDGVEPELEGVHLLEEFLRRERVDLAVHGAVGVWYSRPSRPSRILNSFSTVFASSCSMSAGCELGQVRALPGDGAGPAHAPSLLERLLTAFERVREGGEDVVRHLLLHLLDRRLLVRLVLQERADPVLAEAHVAPLVGDRARQRARELRVHLLVHRVLHLEHGEGEALEHDVLADDARHEVLLVDLLEQHVRERDQVRRRVGLDHVLELGLLHAQVEQPVREDLDVARLVERLGREEALAGLVGRGVAEARRRGQRAALADHELHRAADGVLAQGRVVENRRGLALVRRVAVLGALEVALRARLEPALDRIRGQEIGHREPPP